MIFRHNIYRIIPIYEKVVRVMKKLIILQALIVTVLVAAPVAFGQTTTSPEVMKVNNFIKNAIQVLTIFAGTISGGFFTLGGYGYITSSGNPEGLEKSKKTIMYSAIGLSITSAAYVLTNIVNELATGAFGN